MAKAKLATGDRVARPDTGETATYLVNRDKSHEVLLDHGPKVASNWAKRDVKPVKIGGARRTVCDRCGAKGHKAFDCPEGTT